MTVMAIDGHWKDTGARLSISRHGAGLFGRLGEFNGGVHYSSLLYSTDRLHIPSCTHKLPQFTRPLISQFSKHLPTAPRLQPQP
jgi:hypothetical protein